MYQLSRRPFRSFQFPGRRFGVDGYTRVLLVYWVETLFAGQSNALRRAYQWSDWRIYEWQMACSREIVSGTLDKHSKSLWALLAASSDKKDPKNRRAGRIFLLKPVAFSSDSVQSA